MCGKQNVQPGDEIKLHWFLLGEPFIWTGASFIWPLTSVYLSKRLCVSLAMTGIALLSNCLANMLSSFIAGWAYDHFDPYYLIIAGAGLGILVLLGMAANHTWPTYWVWMTLTRPPGDQNRALTSSIVTSIKPKPGRRVFDMIYFTQNLGVVLGTLIMGYIYDYSVTILFVIAASLPIVVRINAIANYRPVIKFYLKRKAQQNTSSKNKITPMPSANLKLTIGFFTTLVMIWLMCMNRESNLLVYTVSLGIPLHLYSLFWAISASIIVTARAFLSCPPNTFKSLFCQVVSEVTMLVISFVILIFTKDCAHSVLLMVTLILGESATMPAMPAYVNDLSPVESKEKHQGLTISTSMIGRAFGPLFGELVIDKFGYINPFILATAGILMMLAIIVSLHAQLKDKLKTFR